MLYIVATPIGNIEDITLRAIKTLKEVDVIAAEDTRHTLKLLNHYEIKKRLISYHEHNKAKQGDYIIDLITQGKTIALVSDAGTPGISDPGEDIISLAIEAGIEITIIPGPTAAISGLILSGLPTNRYVFEGFLPIKGRDRKERLSELKKEIRTSVLYEAPHKLIATLRDLYETLGNRRIALARELTKKFEEVDRLTLKQAIEMYKEKVPRGEYVIILEGACKSKLDQEKAKEWDDISLEQHFEFYIQSGLDRKEALKRIASDKGMTRKEIYDSMFKK